MVNRVGEQIDHITFTSERRRAYCIQRTTSYVLIIFSILRNCLSITGNFKTIASQLGLKRVCAFMIQRSIAILGMQNGSYVVKYRHTYLFPSVSIFFCRSISITRISSCDRDTFAEKQAPIVSFTSVTYARVRACVL